jgi:hypothetical protein
LNRTLSALIAAATIVTALSGCSSAAPAAETSPTPTQTPTSVPTATPRQFASIIAQYDKTWRDYADNIVKCSLADVQTDTISSMERITCSMTAETVTLDAKSAIRDIVKLPKPDPEVSDLVTRTLDTLTPLSNIDAMTQCKDMTSASCDEAKTAVNGAIRPVVSVLDAWKPYIGS